MQGHEWPDQRDPSVPEEEERMQQHGLSEVVVPPGRQVKRIFRPDDVHRGANEVQEEANETQEEAQP